MNLTVAICTYRRSEPLAAALASLAAADSLPAEVSWELLVVDNAADPAIRAMVESWAGRLPVRYLAEPTLGTSHARNAAVKAAWAPIILFTDDDVTFQSDWLVCMWRAIVEHEPCDFWGGRVEPVWPTPKGPPDWFDVGRCPMLGDTVVQYRHGLTPRAWNPKADPPFYTANLALRVSAVRQVGGFDVQVGHCGQRRMGMEDSLMVLAIAREGRRQGRANGWYAADAVVHHPVPSQRLTKSYGRQFAWRQGWLSVHRARQVEQEAEQEEGKKVGKEAWGERRFPPRWLFRASAQSLLIHLVGWAVGLIKRDGAHRYASEFQLVYHASKLWHGVLGR